jgi:hypothetical protein
MITDFVSTYKKVILVTIILNMIVGISSMVVWLTVTDFAMYYKVSGESVTNWFDNTYNQEFWQLRDTLEYRYFPAILIVFSLFTHVNLAIAYAIFFAINQFLLIVSNAILMKMIDKNQTLSDLSKTMKKCIVLFVLFFLSYDSMFWGQVTILILFFAVLSLYCFQNNKENIASFLIGITIMIKPVLITVVILLFLTKVKRRGLMVLMKRAMFMLIPVVPDIIIFITHETLIADFIAMNFNVIDRPTYRVFSISFVNIIAVISQHIPAISISVVMIVAFVSCVIVGYLITRNVESERKNALIFGFGSFSYVIVFQDVWVGQLVFILPFVFLYLSFSSVSRMKNGITKMAVWFFLVNAIQLVSVVFILITLVMQGFPTVIWESESPWFTFEMAINFTVCSSTLYLAHVFYVQHHLRSIVQTNV